eukprot:11189054-Lingulodinium_polyedra.AAC.1
MAGGKNSGNGAFMSSAASSSVNYVDTVDALLFLMGDESSESLSDFWPQLLEQHGEQHGHQPRGGKA